MFLKCCFHLQRVAMGKAFLQEIIEAGGGDLRHFHHLYDILASDVIPVAPPLVRASQMPSQSSSAGETIFDREMAESSRMAEERAAAQQASSQPGTRVPPVWAPGVDSGVGVSLASASTAHLDDSSDTERESL